MISIEPSFEFYQPDDNLPDRFLSSSSSSSYDSIEEIPEVTSKVQFGVEHKTSTEKKEGEAGEEEEDLANIKSKHNVFIMC